MSVTETYDCRVPGCAGDARYNRGKYAYLCDEHRMEKVRNERPTQPPREGTFEDRVKRLTRAARHLDRTKRKYEVVKAELRAAISDYQAAANELQVVNTDG